MKTIYLAVTPVPPDGTCPQTINCNFVGAIEKAFSDALRSYDARFRVVIHFDTHYKAQCRGEIAYLRQGKFETVLHLTPDEIAVVREWHSAEPPRRLQWRRDGLIARMVGDCARDLAALGAEIVL